LGMSEDCERANVTYKQFFTVRIVVAMLVFVIVMWGLWILLGTFKKPEPLSGARLDEGELALGIGAPDAGGDHHRVQVPASLEGAAPAEEGTLAEVEAPAGLGHVPNQDTSVDHGAPADHGAFPEPLAAVEGGVLHEPKARGVHLVQATISVLDYELNERFWGWRPNDVIRLTDNVENIQLGVLEIARRTTVGLMERMSRLGVSATIDKNLENAMNWLMIKPAKYWLPSAEEKYEDSLKELRAYADKLERGEAHFYARTDTLIPLLLAFADLAGSSEENLVKVVEDDGSPVSWFKCDDYFYYAKGIAKAMEKILHAVGEDFSSVLETRNGVDLLNRAIHACHVASELDPWLVTDAPLDGILANHRANMASEIGHARYFLDALTKALST